MLKISDLKKMSIPQDPSGREIEATALDKAAAMIEYCTDNWDSPKIKELLFEALRHNQTLWSILKNEVQNPDNPLPQNIKDNITALSNFINKRTFEIQSWPSKEKLNILIEINKNIAAGLKGLPLDK
ncbi:MAG: flagellar biosynthesis regulator FlaF [Thermodesulfovibrionales bacterium]|nr:flagellar biosynthesis regulator FlaF [Thermodesulfovibrionales bacterium]